MPFSFLAIGLVLAGALMLLSKKKDPFGDIPADLVLGSASTGPIKAIGSPVVSISNDSGTIGPLVEVTPTTGTIGIDTSWDVENQDCIPHLVGLKVRWIHKRGWPQQDDD